MCSSVAYIFSFRWWRTRVKIIDQLILINTQTWRALRFVGFIVGELSGVKLGTGNDDSQRSVTLLHCSFAERTQWIAHHWLLLLGTNSINRDTSIRSLVIWFLKIWNSNLNSDVLNYENLFDFTFLKYGTGSDSSLASLLVSWIIAFRSVCELTLWWAAPLIRRCMMFIVGAIAFWWICFLFTHVPIKQIIISMKSVRPVTTSPKRITESKIFFSCALETRGCNLRIKSTHISNWFDNFFPCTIGSTHKRADR